MSRGGTWEGGRRVDGAAAPRDSLWERWREARTRGCEAVSPSAQLLLARYGRCGVERSFRTRFIAAACPDQPNTWPGAKHSSSLNARTEQRVKMRLATDAGIIQLKSRHRFFWSLGCLWWCKRGAKSDTAQVVKSGCGEKPNAPKRPPRIKLRVTCFAERCAAKKRTASTPNARRATRDHPGRKTTPDTPSPQHLRLRNH